MVRYFANTDNLRINVVLKDGTRFSNMDVPDSPLGNTETSVSFWTDEHTLCVYPMDMVDHFSLVSTPLEEDA